MFDVLSQVLFALIRTSLQATLNIFLYSLISRIFIRWLGLNTMISFLCSNYCISKILFFIQHLRLSIRLKKKKSEERIFLDQLSWSSARLVRLLIKKISFFKSLSFIAPGNSKLIGKIYLMMIRNIS